MKTIPLCGQNAVQELNARVGRLFLDELATRLRPIAEVSYSAHMLRFKVDDNEIVIFPDGRAILRNSTDESLAKGLYAKYVGT
jgi:adenylyltransferase/sulfurtransferase